MPSLNEIVKDVEALKSEYVRVSNRLAELEDMIEDLIIFNFNRKELEEMLWFVYYYFKIYMKILEMKIECH